MHGALAESGRLVRHGEDALDVEDFINYLILIREARE